MDTLLADDQPQVRSALRLLLEQKTPLRVTGEAASGPELLDQAAALRPGAVLLDWELPGLCPFDGLGAVRRVCPGVWIVALSSRPEARHAALRAGADAFVCKGDPPEALLAALEKRNPVEG